MTSAKNMTVDDVINIFDDVINNFEIFFNFHILNRLKIIWTKFQRFMMSRTGFIVLFLPRAKKPHPPPFRNQKKPAWTRVKDV